MTDETVLSRLNAFLPAISAANRDLESEIAAGTISARNIENVDGSKDEAYIEMVTTLLPPFKLVFFFQ